MNHKTILSYLVILIGVIMIGLFAPSGLLAPVLSGIAFVLLGIIHVTK